MWCSTVSATTSKTSTRTEGPPDRVSRGVLQQAFQRVGKLVDGEPAVQLDIRATAQERHDLLGVVSNFGTVFRRLAVRVVSTSGGSIEEYVERGMQQFDVIEPVVEASLVLDGPAHDHIWMALQ